MPQTDIFSDSYKYNPDYHRFADILGVDHDSRNNVKLAKQMALLYDWAAMDIGKKDMESVSERVHQLSREYGVTFLGKELVEYLYQHVRIHMDRLKEASDMLDTQLKAEVERRKVESEREKGRSWREDQEQIKHNLADAHKVSETELQKYFDHYQKSMPRYDKVEKIEEAPPPDTEAEYV